MQEVLSYPLPVVFDMETHDPDDYITLLLLLGHPKVRLKAVTITPGSVYQVGLVRRTLAAFGVDIPVGAGDLEHPKSCVSSWHEKAYGMIEPSHDAVPAQSLLREICDQETTLITGAPLKNLREAVRDPRFRLGRWVAQGGFAGEGVVPEHLQLPQFRGRRSVPTFNFNGDPKTALAALEHSGIGLRRLVSKNVCHRVFYDVDFHAALAPYRSHCKSLAWIWDGMDVYLQKKIDRAPHPLRYDEQIDASEVLWIDEAGASQGICPTAYALAQSRQRGGYLIEVSPETSPPVARTTLKPPSVSEDAEPIGKKFHDPLAACCAIDPSIATWAEVSLFRERGGWGSVLAPQSNTWIILDYDPRRFFEVFVEASS
ncbi:nucleoside hydrolase [Myxococcota bacterium]|nr:nucleoside hydrolase [Myxococcota bacterium]